MDKQTMLALLKKDVVPALGCTEPVCVALCAAWASQQTEEEIQKIQVTVNPGIYKNGMSAGIPNCRAVGLNYAAAIGVCLKNPGKQLRLLEDLTSQKLEEAEMLIRRNAVSVEMDPGQKGLYVSCRVQTQNGEALCIIRNAHTNLAFLSRNGQTLFEKPLPAGQEEEDSAVAQLKELTVSQIRALVDSASQDELAFLLDGVQMNEDLAAYSEKIPAGVGIAHSFRQEMGSGLLADDLLSRIVAQVSSAAESRLDGCPYPTMSSSGAGTKGLVVILPVSETAKAVHASREKTLRALAFAHLLNRYINAYIGKLSPMCSCVMASSTAASAAMAYLLGGSDEQIGYAIRNMSGTVTGMICDGGKVGCALKVATGSAAAVFSALTAVHNAALRPSDGICAVTPEDCIRNMAHIGKEGMKDMDRQILNIMEQKK